jgi:erythromycin esterase-like protein
MARYTDPWIYTSEDIIKEYQPLDNVQDLDPLVERIGDARYVLLGEASHGTHEYYTWRAAISKRLIMEKGFSFIAVEGDWPDCYRINRFVKSYSNTEKSAIEVLKTFKRWPTWMWANWEIAALMEWMKSYNNNVNNEDKKVGFYGLDVYSLWESLETLLTYLEKVDPKAYELAQQAIYCFEPYQENKSYSGSAYALNDGCREEVVKLLQEVRKNAATYDGDSEAGFNAEMNALVAANAEKYYSAMVSLRDTSWNIRDKHMVETLNALMKFHGENAKVIVWEHNTHIGDARATDMYLDGLLNVGQLVREQHEADGVVLTGFGSFEGTVIAGRKWGAPMQKMQIPPAKENSVEEILHRDSSENKLLIFDRKPKIKDRFNSTLGHRAIGVVYYPEKERGNYVPTKLPLRYDAFLYLDKTQALHPLHIKPDGHLTPELYPFGV